VRLATQLAKKLFETQPLDAQLELERYARIDWEMVVEWAAEYEQKLAQRMIVHLEFAPFARLR
jgi:hypothetical protein